MATRTVRLDNEAEEALQEIVRITGLSISDALKRGLIVYREDAIKTAGIRPYDVYRELELGEGGYAIAPSTEVKSAVRRAICRKHGR